MTPLHLACAAGHTGTACVLLRLGAGPDNRDESGSTPVNYASNQAEMSDKEAFYAAVDFNRAVTNVSAEDDDVCARALTDLHEAVDRDETGALVEVLRTCGGLPPLVACLAPGAHTAQRVHDLTLALLLLALESKSNHAVVLACGALESLAPLISSDAAQETQERAVEVLCTLLESGPPDVTEAVLSFLRSRLPMLVALLSSSAAGAA